MTKKTVQRSTEKQAARAKRVKPPQPPVPLWVQVAQRVQIQDVRLIRCACYLEPEGVSGKKIYEIEQQPTTVETNEESCRIFVFPTFDLKAHQEGRPGKVTLDISASFLLVYKASCLKDLSQEAFQQFADVNGTYNAWPYWREFVQSTTTRMGMPPLVLEAFRIGGQLPQKTPDKTQLAQLGNITDTSSEKVRPPGCEMDGA